MEMKSVMKENTQVVEKYFSSLAKGDLKTLGSLFAEDVVWHQPGQGALSGVHKGKQAVFALFEKFMKISQGSFRIDEVSSIMANGDLVSATLKFSAKKENGSKIAMNGVDLMRVEDKQIKEVYLFSQDQIAEDGFWG